MTLELTPDLIAKYRAAAQQRWQEEEQAQARCRERAWAVARQAAAFLKGEFGVTRVAAFGSLAHGHWFSDTSDVDLAIWGLTGPDYFTAVARLQDLSPEFKIDLVAMEHCRPALHKSIIKGMKLL